LAHALAPHHDAGVAPAVPVDRLLSRLGLLAGRKMAGVRRPPMSDETPLPTDRDSLTQVFLGDLPGMAGIVTVITQPFAQESLRTALRLPDWIPFVIALGISALLAFYRLLIVRRSGRRECVICVPVVMLVVFAAYATGNNLVYYAKEGLTAPMSTDQVAALKHERDLLEQQLRNAEDVIAKMRRALDLPGAPDTKPSSALPRTSAWARLFGVGSAEAQDRRPEPRSPRARPETTERQRLQQELRKYDIEQRQLKERLETVKPDISRPREQQQQQPLIKSW
jgi:hypothetical protein